MADQRLSFVRAVLDGDISISAACKHFGISRVTGHKILRRFEEDGVRGLNDRSRAPRHRPNAISDERVRQILDLKAAHPTWGPKKLRAFLLRLDPEATLPATSTFGDILARAGLVKPRRPRPRSHHCGAPLTQASRSNQVWGIDYKGQFRLGNHGPYCYPLTITDDETRFLIRCQALADTSASKAWPCFVGAFMEFGLPEIIRSDNGPPFGSASVIGLSWLSLQFLKLGIVHEYMTPATPTQNARHERMHKTLKAEATGSPPAQMLDQQRRFDAWRASYNTERPHEGIGMKTPSDLYVASPRPFPPVMPCFEYPQGMRLLKVRPNGCIQWLGSELFVSEVLIGERIGIDHFDEALHAIYIGCLPVAILDEATRGLLPAKQAAPHLQALRRSSASPISTRGASIAVTIA